MIQGLKEMNLRRWIILSAIFIIPFFLRLFFLNAIKHDPVFTMPIIDSLEFDVWGYQIAQGQILWDQLQNHPPLYAYFLAFIYKIFGYNPLHVALIQYVLMSISTLLVFLIVEKLINSLTAYVSVFVMTMYWFLIYLPSFIFSENLALFLNICAVSVIVFKREGYAKYILLGIVLGVSSICRPEILVFTACYLLWLVFQHQHPKRFIQALLVVLCISLFVLPVILRNQIVFGQPVLRTQIGANIFMGSSKEYKGTNLNVEIGKPWENFISIPDRALGRPVSEQEANRYFIQLTFQRIIQAPIEWLNFIGSKLYMLVLGKEFLRTEDAYVYQQFISNTPYALVTTNLIFILAWVGVFLSMRCLTQVFVMRAMVFCCIAAFLFFPLRTRYLMPSAPLFIIFAAYAITQLIVFVSEKQVKIIGLWLCAVLFLCAGSLLNPLQLPATTIAETLYAVGKNYAVRSQFSKAEKYFEAALKVNPANDSVLNDLGVIYMNKQQYKQAVDYFKRAMDIDPLAKAPRENFKICLNKSNVILNKP